MRPLATQTIAPAEEDRAYFHRVFAWMGTGLFVTGLVAYLIGRSSRALHFLFESHPGVFAVCIIVELVLVAVLVGLVKHMSLFETAGTFLAYAALNGLTISFIFAVYTTGSIYSTFLGLFCLAAAGFPGLNSFVGEFLIISGVFKTTWPWLGVMAIWGVALGTTYIVWLYYRVALGDTRPGLPTLGIDLNAREVATLAPLALLTVVIGLYPDAVLGFLRTSVEQLLAAMTAPGTLAGRM